MRTGRSDWATANGWTRLKAAGFGVLLTTDKNLRCQQDLSGRKLAIVVFGQGRWGLVRRHVAAVVAAVNAATPGSYAEVQIPYD